jgi:hypothetical protein
MIISAAALHDRYAKLPDGSVAFIDAPGLAKFIFCPACGEWL